MKPSRVQAVVLIHGIGEQMPMHTLRRFLEAVWTRADRVHHPSSPARVWSKPDPVSGNVALPKLVTSRNAAGQRTEFFEFYWAHFMTETNLSHVLAWVRVLMLRWPWNLPTRLLRVWFVVVVVTIAIFALAAYLHGQLFTTPSWWSYLAGLLAASIVDVFIIRTLGDAARYLHRTPRNTARRVEILTKGIELLRSIHESGRYDRVIVVGHSLGSVIGYDILTYLWAFYHAQHNSERAPSSPSPDQTEIENLASEARLDPDVYQQAQRRYREDLRSSGNNWLVTDFITLGSPLTHAAVLLARNQCELRLRQQEREFPTCPPVLEDGHFTYRTRTGWMPHHAAVFGPTCWTNIYFSGDIVGGPLRPVFGPGIRDIAVGVRWWRSLVCHTRYWSLPNEGDTPDTVKALRKLLHIAEQEAPH